jgi:hypothetical protein
MDSQIIAACGEKLFGIVEFRKESDSTAACGETFIHKRGGFLSEDRKV